VLGFVSNFCNDAKMDRANALLAALFQPGCEPNSCRRHEAVSLKHTPHAADAIRSTIAGFRIASEISVPQTLSPLHLRSSPEVVAPQGNSTLTPISPLSSRRRWKFARGSAGFAPTNAANAGRALGSPAASISKAVA
jgi:hypothetical protein